MQNGEFNGVINFLKPVGMSSGQAVGFVRRVLGQKKVGHTGTLDPGAAGVLPICVGRSTRLSDILMTRKKAYVAMAVFGSATDTLDSHGEVTEVKECEVTRAEFEGAMIRFTGEITQIPPAYSAIKIGGRPAYKTARAGGEVDIKPRNVSIYDIKYLSHEGKNRHLFFVRCSKGTYIRTLITDIARELGEVAHMGYLCRVESGGFHVENSYTIDEIERMAGAGDYSFINTPQSMLGELDEIVLNEKFRGDIDNGRVISVNVPDGEYNVFCEHEFYGIGDVSAGELKLSVLLKDKLL